MQQQKVEKKGKFPNRVAKEKFYGRRISLLNKANQIGEMCKADVYIVFYHKHWYYTYSNNKKAYWPSSESDIISHLLFLYNLCNNLF